MNPETPPILPQARDNQKPAGWFQPPAFLRAIAMPLKVAFAGFVILILLIPLGMIESTLNERLGRRNEAVREITSTWGQAQRVIGPVWTLPYSIPITLTNREIANGRVRITETKSARRGTLCHLPDTLEIEAGLAPEIRYRGIFKTVVYRGAVTMAGVFSPPDWAKFGLKPEHVDWARTEVSLAVSDLRGVRDTITLEWGTNTFPTAPGCRVPGQSSGLFAAPQFKAAPTNAVPFSLAFDLSGSGPIQFAPVARKTAALVKSPWPDPSFCGAFLPSERGIGPEGFSGKWDISYYGRAYPQTWVVEDAGKAAAQLGDALFGVELLTVVDFYRNVERAIKYGVLFLVLVFGAFFLFEQLARLPIHSLQYLLVGGALCLFYLALLALSEFIPFAHAYAAAAGASLLLIACYARSFLGGWARVGTFSAGLAAVYGYLFVLLQLQDYSLLFGTAGLFVLLGGVMFATRNLGRRQTPAPGAAQ